MRPWIITVTITEGNVTEIRFVVYCTEDKIESMIMKELSKMKIHYNENVGYESHFLMPNQPVTI